MGLLVTHKPWDHPSKPWDHSMNLLLYIELWYVIQLNTLLLCSEHNNDIKNGIESILFWLMGLLVTHKPWDHPSKPWDHSMNLLLYIELWYVIQLNTLLLCSEHNNDIKNGIESILFWLMGLLVTHEPWDHLWKPWDNSKNFLL